MICFNYIKNSLVGEDMANKNKKNKNKKNTYYNKSGNSKKDEIAEKNGLTTEYKNPAKTKWGKIIIVTLAVLMALSGLISLIVLMAQNR